MKILSFSEGAEDTLKDITGFFLSRSFMCSKYDKPSGNQQYKFAISQHILHSVMISFHRLPAECFDCYHAAWVVWTVVDQILHDLHDGTVSKHGRPDDCQLNETEERHVGNWLCSQCWAGICIDGFCEVTLLSIWSPHPPTHLPLNYLQNRIHSPEKNWMVEEVFFFF